MQAQGLPFKISLWGLILILLVGTTGCSPDRPSKPAGGSPADLRGLPVASDDGARFLLGVNYPWYYYGQDFGASAWGHRGVSTPAALTQVDQDFAYLHSKGVRVVRWFVFCDGRASPDFDATGRVTGLDLHFFADMDAALAVAEKHQIKLIFVLFDYKLLESRRQANGVLMGGHVQLVSEPAYRQTLIDNALKPLLARYGKNRTIIAWEVINEPEWAMDVPAGALVEKPVSAAAMQGFVRAVVDAIHAHTGQLATVGSASRGWLGYWTGSNLDFYQFHYYERRDSRYPLDYPYAALKLDKPCIVGEFPTHGTSRAAVQYIDTAYRNGYAGALAWSYRSRDRASRFKDDAGDFLSWSKDHDKEIDLR